MADDENVMSRRLVTLFYALVLAGGVTLYIAWGIMYDAWNIMEISNIAIYSLVIIMVGIGLVGLLLYGRRQEIQ